jgi:hypothetical protein
VAERRFAAALLTVFGGSHPHPVAPDFGHAILPFAFGAAFSVFMFIWAAALQPPRHPQKEAS